MLDSLTPKQRIINEKSIEKREAISTILSVTSDEITVEELLKTKDSYIKKTIVNLEREIQIVKKYIDDLSSLVMVGFGYFPSTIILLRRELPNLKLLGIDCDPEACDFSRSVLSKFESTRNIELLNLEAGKFNYKGIDAIFLANALLNKKGIIRSIYETSERNSLIFSRTPVFSYRNMFESLPFESGFEVMETLNGEENNLYVLTKKENILKG